MAGTFSQVEACIQNAFETLLRAQKQNSIGTACEFDMMGSRL